MLLIAVARRGEQAEHSGEQCTGETSNPEPISRLQATTGELSCAAMK